ncbi:MAG: hypothetical protein U5K43_10090 [Halofilum sp. (in: g-proteobacteria)]|nr:hypothetical protein [Halofilum sp. (in: g-proteobacteria)]
MLDQRVLHVAVGLAVLGFVVLQVSRRPLAVPRAHETLASCVFGTASGLARGLAGASGPIMASYMYSLRLSPRDFVMLTCLVYLAFDVSQLSGIFYADLFSTTPAGGTHSSSSRRCWLAPGFGLWSRRALSAETFRRIVLVALAIIALNLLRKGLLA